jgi:hypothetical protein
MVCPHCGKSIDLFHTGGGADLAAKTGLSLLASIPFTQGVVEAGDAGAPQSEPFNGLVEVIMERLKV